MPAASAPIMQVDAGEGRTPMRLDLLRRSGPPSAADMVRRQPAASTAPVGVAARCRKRHPGHVRPTKQGGSYEGQASV
jgi:hypothetical protein